MNQFVPDWSSNMGDAFAPLGGEDDGLMELLWCKGHVVMQSQAPRKPAPAAMQEHEAAPWFQYPVDDGSLESDLFSEIFGDLPADAGRACKEEEEEEEEVVVERGAAVTALQSGLMPGPAHAPWEKAGFWPDVGDAARGPSVGEGAAAATEAGESSSVVTVGSRSVCGSNHVQTPGAARARDTAGDSAPPPPMTRNGTVTSLPMRSKPSGAASRGGGGKRKQRDAMEQPESTSLQDVESESGAVTCDEPPQKLTTARRRRAAEVHNLSERRRRDRINEKMKALQELIPHCNKTDKASMLDEAIEYLKSLQLQLQKMWMGGGGGMETAAAAAAAPRPAPVMFPAGVHQYMQRMAASMPRMPPPFMPAAQGSPVSHLPAAVGSMAVDAYARCLAVEHLQPPPSPMHYLQGMGFYQLGTAMNLQQSPPSPAVPAASLPAATARTLPPDNALHKNYCVKL